MYGQLQEFSEVKAIKVKEGKTQALPIGETFVVPKEDAKLLSKAGKVEIVKETVKHPNPSFQPDNLK
jgi:hypothetical protein